MIVLKWADGNYSFQLLGKQIEELQRMCGNGVAPIGVGAIAERLFNKQFFYSDIFHTIRLGLIGGGTPAVRAQELVDTYIDGKSLANPEDPSNPLRTAQAVFEDLFFELGSVGEPPKGERKAAKPKAASSTSRRSKRKP